MTGSSQSRQPESVQEIKLCCTERRWECRDTRSRRRRRRSLRALSMQCQDEGGSSYLSRVREPEGRRRCASLISDEVEKKRKEMRGRKARVDVTAKVGAGKQKKAKWGEEQSMSKSPSPHTPLHILIERLPTSHSHCFPVHTFLPENYRPTYSQSAVGIRNTRVV